MRRLLLLVLALLTIAAPAAALAQGGGYGWHDDAHESAVAGPDVEDDLDDEDQAGDEDGYDDEEGYDDEDEAWLDDEPDVPEPTADEPGATTPPTGGHDPQVPYGSLIAATARRRGVPVALFTALVWQESAFKPRARSKAGARGLTQLRPATARRLRVRKIYDPAQNLDGGARHLRSLLTRFRSKRLALAAYNAGPRAVKRFKGVPPYRETRRYVTRVLVLERALVRAGVR